MIQRVVERAMMSSAKQVVVAVDDDRIAENVTKTTEATVVLTSRYHSSGSDRIAEAVKLLNISGSRIIVNVQGDEPLISTNLIDCVAQVLYADPLAQISTAAVPIDLRVTGKDPNQVKCVVDQHHRALYFSRSMIPWINSKYEQSSIMGLHHVGIYAYTVDYLVHQHAAREICPLERFEGLEQLRALYYGDTIAVHIDNYYQGIGVDTQQDLEQVRSIIFELDK